MRDNLLPTVFRFSWGRRPRLVWPPRCSESWSGWSSSASSSTTTSSSPKFWTAKTILFVFLFVVYLTKWPLPYLGSLPNLYLLLLKYNLSLQLFLLGKLILLCPLVFIHIYICFFCGLDFVLFFFTIAPFLPRHVHFVLII